MLEFHRKNHKIGLDLDEVCADFLHGFSDFMNVDYKTAKNHYFSYQTWDNLQTLPDEFWINLPAKMDGGALPFLPACYISRRHFSTSLSMQWLEKNNYPCVPVIHVTGSKLDACKEMGVDIFVDDFIANFQDLESGGIKTILMDCTHNQQYNVGEQRVKSLIEVPNKIMQLGW